MSPAAPRELPISTVNTLQVILDGGPLYVVLHLLFAISVIVAMVVIFRRASLPWTLFASCAPYICASAAAHVGFLRHLMVLDTLTTLAEQVDPFLYDKHLFNYGCIIAAIFVILSFCLRAAKKQIPVVLDPSPGK